MFIFYSLNKPWWLSASVNSAFLFYQNIQYLPWYKINPLYFYTFLTLKEKCFFYLGGPKTITGGWNKEGTGKTGGPGSSQGPHL